MKDKVIVKVKGNSGWEEVGIMGDTIYIKDTFTGKEQSIILKEGDVIEVTADEDSHE